MALSRFVKQAAPSFVRDYMNNIQARLVRLETLEPRLNALQASIGYLENAVDSLIYTPRYVAGDDVGFNGQLLRKKIFGELVAAFNFRCIVETGTWTGNTAGYMAELSRLPVFSAEVNHRFHSVARIRLVDFPGITLRHSDSRRFLMELAADSTLTSGLTFFYLDAHWYADLPLREEIDLIASRWRDFVIMIDDFQVPGDEGYGYDDFGSGKALTLEYVAPSLLSNHLTTWFPSDSSGDETGARRGCVVLVREGAASDKVSTLSSLSRRNIQAGARTADS